ncbi:MAG TPA: phage holin family protein [Nitrospiria bacterium]|nr:phage holin family protein [Nitrospiria bacterium]
MKIFLRWLINAVGILFASRLIEGIHIDNVTTALVAAGLIGIINLLIRPFIIILTLPINILTLGLFTFVINGSIFYLIGNTVKGMAVDNFWAALLGAFLVSLINGIAHLLIKSSPQEESRRQR